MKKRIAMISYHTCPLASFEGKETGGMNVYILELGKALAALGHTVDVFTRSQDMDNQTVVDVVPGFRVVHIIAGPEKHVNKKQLTPYMPDFINKSLKFQSKEQKSYDVIHAHYYLSGLIAHELQRTDGFRGVPLVVSFHTLALMKNLVARDESEKEEDARVTAEITLGETAARVIANSQSDAQYLEYLYGVPAKKLSVIPPGVNTALFRPMPLAEAKKALGISTGQKMIVFVGRVEPLKGIDMLLYSTKIVTTRNPDMPVCVCIVGGDITAPAIRWSVTLQSLNHIRQTLNLTATVKFIGQQDQDVLPLYYNAADLVVMPSHYESFGMAALEAMSCGVPVITTNAAGISSLIDERHDALITSVNNPLLLANQIEYFLKTPQKRDTLGAQLRENVSDLTWESVATGVSAVYDQVTQ